MKFGDGSDIKTVGIIYPTIIEYGKKRSGFVSKMTVMGEGCFLDFSSVIAVGEVHIWTAQYIGMTTPHGIN
jgi:hypothetical protein